MTEATRRPHILEVTPEQLSEWLEGQDQPGYRLGQILDWTCVRRADSFDAMTNLPAELRHDLCEHYSIEPLTERGRLTSENGATGKLLFELDDGEQIESVWMDDDGRHTFCISSQAGCPLGCVFCATGAAGYGRDLTVAEILGQVTALARVTGRLRNVVFMGMGEPLLNLDAVIPALEALADERRFGIGARHLTVSTAGITPGIAELAACGVRPNLALSLNSPFDEQRGELMPVTRKYPLADVLRACEEYARATGRRMALEYVLLGGVNTSADAAAAVAQIAHRLKALVNLIAFNTVSDTGLRAPDRDEAARFRAALEKEDVEVTERYRRGRDIAAACGQLRGTHPRHDRGK
ncbi:MAG: 23S rRNA (adenine(2503)-C(2))-methyltransferase RlmN [Planctomycetota bacterium]